MLCIKIQKPGKGLRTWKTCLCPALDEDTEDTEKNVLRSQKQVVSMMTAIPFCIKLSRVWKTSALTLELIT